MIGYILLSLVIITLGWTTFNLTRKVERLETWVEDYAERIQTTKQILDDVDTTGHFEADDEVGVIFTSIKDTIEELNQYIEEDTNAKES